MEIIRGAYGDGFAEPLVDGEMDPYPRTQLAFIFGRESAIKILIPPCCLCYFARYLNLAGVVHLELGLIVFEVFSMVNRLASYLVALQIHKASPWWERKWLLVQR